MEKKPETTIKISLFCSFLFLFILCTVNGDYGSTDLGESSQEKPSLAQRFTKIAIELGKSSQGSWGKFKSLIYQVQENFFPPTLDFRSRDAQFSVEAGGKNPATARMTDAVEKSLGSSESTFEGSAESMSRVVGEAVQMTKEKVKETMSEKSGEDEHKRDEL